MKSVEHAVTWALYVVVYAGVGFGLLGVGKHVVREISDMLRERRFARKLREMERKI